MNIRGKRVVLRAIEHEDLTSLQRWSNDPETQSLLGGWHFPASSNDMEHWFQSLREDTLNQRFAIITEPGGLVGTANLVNINWKDRNATHGMMLGEPDQRQQGLGTDTVMAIMRYAFDELGLHRLESTIIEDNRPSISLYVKTCGWKEEGRLREWYWRKSRWLDKILVGITVDEYRELLAATRYWG